VKKERKMSHEPYNTENLCGATTVHYNATGKKALLNLLRLKIIVHRKKPR